MFGVLSVGNKDGSGPYLAQYKTADGNITSLVSCFSRHFHSADGSDARLLSMIPSCKRTDGRTGRAPRGEAESSQASSREEAMPIKRLGLCGSKSLGHHPMGTPKTGPLSARLHSYTIRTSREALEQTPR